MADDARAQNGRRLAVGEADHNAVVDFLTREAWLLDDNDLQGWFALMAEDLSYRCPNRLTVGRRQIGAFPEGGGHFDEDYASLRVRVRRLSESSAVWAEDPPSRTRRLVANVVVTEGATHGELLGRSALLVTRSRGDQHQADVISAERRDVLRKTDSGLRLVSRTILLDHTVLGTPNLAIFL